MKKYIINSRIVKGSNTGISRFVSNLVPYLQDFGYEKYPKFKIFYRGILGHIWDIFAFAFYYNDNVWLTSHRGSPFLNNYVITIHDLQPIVSRKDFPYYYYLYYKVLIKIHLNNSKHIFTVSQKVKSEIIKYYNVASEKITVTYPGHEHLFKYQFNCFKKFSNFEYAIMYGNISKVKNSLLNIIHWIQLNKKKSLKLLIIGNLDNSIKNHFNEILRNNNNLIYLKFVNDEELFWYLRNAKYLYFNSPNEGFGIPALEAVFFRVPVLYSSNSSISEFISNYGVCAEQNNINSLSDALDKILQIDVKSIKYERIRLNILAKCSWSNSARIMIDILNKC